MLHFLLLSCAVHAAPVRVPLFETRLHPTIVGRLIEPGNPLLPVLRMQARDVLSHPSLAARDLSKWASAQPPHRGAPLAKISAGVIARVLAEPGLADAAAQANPGVALPWHRLGNALAQEGPAGRGGAESLNPELIRLADAARSVEAVSQVLEGRGGGLHLEGLSLAGGRPFAEGRSGSRVRAWEHSEEFTHPALKGASLEVYAAPMGPNEPIPEEIVAARGRALALAEAGAGPRHFGLDYFADSRRGLKEPFRAVAVKERVDGRTALDLAVDERLGDEERGMIERALRKALEAGLSLDGVDGDGVMIGKTAAVFERRAYVVGARRPFTPVENPEAALHAWWSRFEAQAELRRSWARHLRILD
jgi:hypothetical protein